MLRKIIAFLLLASAFAAGAYTSINGYSTDFTGAQGASITTIPGWSYIQHPNGLGSTATIDNNRLKIFNAGADSSETYSGPVYTLPSSYTGFAKIEYDLTWADGNSWDFSERVFDD